MTPPDWSNATEPTADEIARVVSPLSPGLAEACREATTPLDQEVRHLRPVRIVRGSPWGLPVAAIGGLALVIALVTMARPQIVPVESVPIGASHLDGEAILAPAILVRGLGEVEVLRIDPAEVAVTEGSVAFDAGKPVVVHIGPVILRTAAALFRVQALDGVVIVRVDRGEVDAQAPDRHDLVHAGESWRWSEPQAAKAPVVPISPEAAVPPEVARRPEVRPHPVPPAETPAASADQVAFAALLDRVDAGGDPGELVASFDAFLAAWPDSSLATEAEALRLEQRAHQAPSPAVTEMEAWLLMHPDSPRRLQIERLAAITAKDRLHDCGRALPHYRALTEVDADPDTWAWRGLCAEAIDADEARASLNEAVERGVKPPLLDSVRAALARL